MRRLFGILWLISAPVFAQVDSVTVSGRILNLTPRLYRQSPNVIISRNNLLQPSAEFSRPAPLNPDGTYSVKLPVIFSQEEMYFSFASVNTAFLAAPGTITINLNADSLFRSAIPFVFGGVNARVNEQYARYKAFEAKQPKIDNERLSRQVTTLEIPKAFERLKAAYGESYAKFSRDVERPYPLLDQWITSISQYNASAFLYDMVAMEQRAIPSSVIAMVFPPGDSLLTAARAVALGRYVSLLNEQINGQNTSLPIRRLAGLLLNYGKNLTDEEKSKLTGWQQASSARVSDLRLMQRIMTRNPDTLQYLVSYEMLIDMATQKVDSVTTQAIAGSWLAGLLPTVTIDHARMLYAYVRPQIRNGPVVRSINELYSLAVSDSARVRQAMKQLKPDVNTNVELTPGIFVWQNSKQSGTTLLNQWLAQNRSRLVYIMAWTLDDERGRRSAAFAQRLRELYDPAELSVLYVAAPDTDTQRLPQYLVRNNLLGDHLIVSRSQFSDVLEQLGAVDMTGAFLKLKGSRIIPVEMASPDSLPELIKTIDKRLK